MDLLVDLPILPLPDQIRDELDFFQPLGTVERRVGPKPYRHHLAEQLFGSRAADDERVRPNRTTRFDADASVLLRLQIQGWNAKEPQL